MRGPTGAVKVLLTPPLSARLRSLRSSVLNPLSSPPPSSATKSCTLAPTEGQEQHEKPVGHVRVSGYCSACPPGGERCEGRPVRRRAADADLPGIRVGDHRRRQPQRHRRGQLPARPASASGSDALPLLRMGGEKIFRAPYTVPDRFAGSILDLEPDTEYEVRLTMKDPDGVSGQAVQTAKVRTRGEPKAAAGGRVLHVYPPTWRGAKEEPNFTGLDGRVCRRRHGRLERRVSEQGRSGRHHPRARRALQGRSPQLRGPAQHDVRRRLPADREGHAGAADRHSTRPATAR